jgi:2,4-dienoyl-CoA reductase-like NADH-dependent reductase (Old Yellow Enzyme family)
LDGWHVPAALDDAELDRVRDAFRDATQRSLAAGFEVIEIHAAHGYLLHQFLSPLVNQRGDEYGGGLQDRMRFPLEIVSLVRKEWPEHLPLIVRISATDWTEGGWDLAQSISFARECKRIGVDMIDCSSGGTVAGAKIEIGPGYQVPFAEAVRRDAEIATGAVGMITGAQQADEIIREGKADAVLLARELLRDPYWPRRAAQELGVSIPTPNQYARAW